MKEKNIQQLLDKYFDGDTCFKEEQQLKAYFRSEQVQPEHERYRSLFTYFDEVKGEVVSDGFDKEINKKLNEKGRVITLPIWFSRVAAAVILLLVAYIGYQNASAPPPLSIEEKWAKAEVEDPQVAFEITKQALLLASSKFNKGTSKASGNINNLKKITRVLKKEE